jgi:hypothetical protein
MTLALKKLSSNKVWLLTAVLAVGLLIPQLAFAVDWGGIIGDLIFNIVITPASKLLELELWILPMIAQYNNFTGQPGVIKGWVALRDLANMFFILILLVIAFSTILRIQKYGYRQLLSRFLIMAILINFSMTIVGLVIDLSQVVMLTFVASIKEVAAGNIVVALGLDNVMILGPEGAGSANYMLAMFFGAIMLIITVVIVAIFVMMLAMRIVKLWIEIVLAPIAFLAYTFPDTQRFYNEWVQEVIKDIVVGPSLAFFLWLAFTITGSAEVGKEIIKVGDEETNNNIGADISKAASPVNLINFVIGISMLMAGLQMSAKAGGAGAGIAGKVSSSMGAIPGRMGRRAGGLAKAGAKGAVVGTAGLAAVGIARGHDLASSSLTDGRGNMKEGGIRNALNTISGGRLQRASVRASTRRGDRLTAKADKREKGVGEQYLGAYRRSRLDKDGNKRGFESDSMITSSDVANMREKFDSGTATAEEMPKLIKVAETTGDFDRLKKQRVTRADAFTTDKDVSTAMQENGAGFIARFSEDSLLQEKYDENGERVQDAEGNDAFEPNEAAMRIASGLINNDSIDSEAIGKELAKMPEKSREAIMQAFDNLDIDMADAFKTVGSGDDAKTTVNTGSTAGKKLMVTMQNAPHKSADTLKQAALESQANKGAAEEAIVKSVSKGLDFSKIAKLDLKIDAQRELFVEFSKNATNAQQKQMFDNSDDDEQIKLMVKTLRDEKKTVNKILADRADQVSTGSGRQAGFR